MGKGASVTAADNNGWTPLHYAAQLCDLRIIRYLVEQGADVTAKTSSTLARWARNKIPRAFAFSCSREVQEYLYNQEQLVEE